MWSLYICFGVNAIKLLGVKSFLNNVGYGIGYGEVDTLGREEI